MWVPQCAPRSTFLNRKNNREKRKKHSVDFYLCVLSLPLSHATFVSGRVMTNDRKSFKQQNRCFALCVWRMKKFGLRFIFQLRNSRILSVCVFCSFFGAIQSNIIERTHSHSHNEQKDREQKQILWLRSIKLTLKCEFAFKSHCKIEI